MNPYSCDLEEHMPSQSASWTIMVYISADNVLANFAIESLKQLRDAAGDGISVIAEFDDNQHDDARLYFFDGDPQKRTLPIESSRIPEREIAHLKTIRDVDMTRPESLTEFVDYASGKSKTERYALVLWGHGIELLLDENRRFGAPNGSVRRYLTIANLKKALQDTKIVKGELEASHPKAIWNDAQTGPKKGNTLDVVGLDACSLSMVEVASELEGAVDFMIASQEDVPDASFPYQRILADLKTQNVRNDVREVCKSIPGLYQQAFRDYIATPDTGVKGITLASLNLAEIGTITEPLKELATALLRSSYDKSVRGEIRSARKEAKSFVFGLLVDLSDFCQRLEAKLASKAIEGDGLYSACQRVQKAIKARSDDACVLENRVDENRCNGLSIYLPYRAEDETDDVEELFAKGGSRQPLKGGSRQPLKERTARIRELEADFADLRAFRGTGWNDFIKRGWSFILANEIPFELDLHYSAEQVAHNLFARGPELVNVREGASPGPADYQEPPAA
jgi:hypothetical protein